MMILGVVAVGVVAGTGIYEAMKNTCTKNDICAKDIVRSALTHALDTERLVRINTDAQLAAERLACINTDAQLAAERLARINTDAQLAAERLAHQATKEKLIHELLTVSDEVLASCSHTDIESYVELCAQYGVPCRLSTAHKQLELDNICSV
jgi:phage FluMu protein gp41